MWIGLQPETLRKQEESSPVYNPDAFTDALFLLFKSEFHHERKSHVRHCANSTVLIKPGYVHLNMNAYHFVSICFYMSLDPSLKYKTIYLNQLFCTSSFHVSLDQTECSNNWNTHTRLYYQMKIVLPTCLMAIISVDTHIKEHTLHAATPKICITPTLTNSLRLCFKTH